MHVNWWVIQKNELSYMQVIAGKFLLDIFFAETGIYNAGPLFGRTIKYEPLPVAVI